MCEHHIIARFCLRCKTLGHRSTPRAIKGRIRRQRILRDLVPQSELTQLLARIQARGVHR